MQKNRLEYLFKKYIHKQYTQAEYAEFMRLITEERNDENLKALLDTVYKDSLFEVQLPSHKADRILKTIINEQSDYYKSSKSKSLFKMRTYLGWAAVLLIFLSAGVILYLYARPEIQKVTFAQSNSKNTHKMVKLSDGSTVILNKYSSVRYPLTFNGNIREIFLTGEGYFDIKHDSRRPFIVHTGKLAITVLGTAFNVRSNPADKNIIVTVTRGKVSVSHNHVVLGVITPDQQITYNKKSNRSHRHIIDTKDVVEWCNKDLFFDNVTMLDAVELLRKKFNVKMSFNSEKVKGCRFTGTFLYGEKLEQILTVICSFNNAAYEIKPNGEIVIGGSGC